MRPLKELVRPNIWELSPYSSARDEYKGVTATVFLDANESPYNTPFNRYPDPLQLEVKAQLEKLKGVPQASIFLGNGSDEAIDLVFRVFCNPGKDNVVAIEPTYGMYAVCADINDVAYRRVPLDKDFQMDADALLAATDENTKVIFLCSPNNPTGNVLHRAQIVKLLTGFSGIVVLDEAYADYSSAPSFRKELDAYPNLIILNTFSKAWASAGIRLGMAFASPEIVALFNKVKYPYNVNILTQKAALDLMNKRHELNDWRNRILHERTTLMANFKLLPCCKHVYPTDANFFLAKMDNATKIYDYLIRQGIVVRNRSKIMLCDDCLRITIGTPQENTSLLRALRQYSV